MDYQSVQYLKKDDFTADLLPVVSGRAVNDANFLSNGDLTDIFLYFCFRKAKLKAPCLILFMSLRNDEYDTDLLDDEPIIRKLLARMMELEGYEVFQAADRASGMKQLTAKMPQLVLCDVFLPVATGWRW